MGRIAGTLQHVLQHASARVLASLAVFGGCSREVGMTVRLVVHYKGLSMDMVRRCAEEQCSLVYAYTMCACMQCGLHTVQYSAV